MYLAMIYLYEVYLYIFSTSDIYLETIRQGNIHRNYCADLSYISDYGETPQVRIRK